MSRDLMYTEETQVLVREAYSTLRSPGAPAAGFYDDAELAVLPPGAEEWALGVGNPVRHAGLAAGETVVDLGCGAGLDVLLAADRVGPSGRAIGVDLLDTMVERGRRMAAQAGLENTRFLQGEMEDVPLPDRVADVAISNGAVNLSARKSRVLAEAHRVLRPGGRLCVADLTLDDEDLPPEILTHPSAWAG